MRWSWAVVIVVLAMAGMAAGCGGDDESEADPTAAWASGFCSAVTDWTNELGTITSEFSDTSNLSQEGLQSAASDLRDSTDTLVSDLKDLGAPDTQSGEEVKNSLDSLSTTLEDEASEIETTAQGVSSIADLPDAITKISASLSALGTAFSQTLQTIDSADVGGELQTALEDSPECADIKSS
jgi:methyl-accepting chemotaxis protein